jgi:hypothetical protein
MKVTKSPKLHDPNHSFCLNFFFFFFFFGFFYFQSIYSQLQVDWVEAGSTIGEGEGGAVVVGAGVGVLYAAQAGLWFAALLYLESLFRWGREGTWEKKIVGFETRAASEGGENIFGLIQGRKLTRKVESAIAELREGATKHRAAACI